MSNAVYPELPGLAFGVRRRPIWSTQADRAVTGREFRSSLMAYPDYEFLLTYEFLRATPAWQELQQVEGFFNARRGSWDSFLWRDPDDYTVSGQSIGTGTGAQTAFTMLRTRGGFAEPVMDFMSAPAVYVGGVLQGVATYSIASGLITFNAPPANGAAVTWTGTYYRRVRFLRDELEFEKFLSDLWSAGKVELKLVKS